VTLSLDQQILRRRNLDEILEDCQRQAIGRSTLPVGTSLVNRAALPALRASNKILVQKKSRLDEEAAFAIAVAAGGPEVLVVGEIQRRRL